MPYGLRESDMAHILSAVAELPEISAVVLFGSRAKGNYQLGSDVDLAILGAGVTDKTVMQLADRLNEEAPLPYFFDIVNYGLIESDRLREHIDRVGIVVFNR
jgi:uncharacterized protein